MKENAILDNSSTTNKKFICSTAWFYFIPTFFGPLAGCYFLAKNFKVLNNEKYARNSWLLIGASIILLVLLSSMPVTEKIFKAHALMLVTAQSAIIASVSHVYQREKLKKFVKMGYQKYPVWKILVFSLLWTLLTIVICCVLTTIFSFIFKR